MTAILYILFAASVGLALTKLLRLPGAPVLILMGAAMDYADVPIDGDLARDGLLLGLTFLVFLSGTALNPWRIGPRSSLAFSIGASQFFLLGFLAFGISFTLNFSLIESLYLGLALASSSTLVVIKLLQNRGELFEPFGRIMVGALLAQDILIMLVISGLSRLGEGAAQVALSILFMAFLIILGVVFKKWVVPWLLVNSKVDEEQQLVLSLGVLFIFIGVSSFFKLPFLIGAFIAGVSLSSFPINGILKGQFATLNNFFNALFFVTLGLFVDFSVDNIALVAGFSLLIVFVTPALATSIAAAAGLTFRSGIEGGLLLAQTSEFSIVLALIGMENGHLEQSHLNLITSITVTTMILTPFLSHEKVSTFLIKSIAKFAPKEDYSKVTKNHFVLFGCGESGMALLEKLLEKNLPVIVVDDDIGVTRSLRARGVETILGNGRDPRVMKKANLEGARLAISSMRKFSDNRAVVARALDTPKIIRVFDQREAAVLERLGVESIPVTVAATEELLEWMDKYFQEPVKT